MNSELDFYTQDLVPDLEKSDCESSTDFLSEWGFIPPEDYLNFRSKFKLVEGPVGKNSWINFWELSELKNINRDYSLLMDQISDYFLFGKDSADTGYAFHKQYGTFHSFGLMSNFATDRIDFCGNNFTEFMQYLYEQ